MGEFRRKFPKFDKCLFIFPKRISVFVSTILIIIFDIAFIGNIVIVNSKYFDGINGGDSFGVLVTFIAIASSVLLLIGIKKDRIEFMKQFKIIFLPYLIFSLAIYFVNTLILISGKNREDTIISFKEQYIEDNINNNTLTIPTDDEIKHDYNNAVTNVLIGYIVGVLLHLWYYITTCSYIEDMEEMAYENEKTRNLENNQIS